MFSTEALFCVFVGERGMSVVLYQLFPAFPTHKTSYVFICIHMYSYDDMYLCMYLFNVCMYVSIYLPTYLPTYLSIYLSTYLYIYLYI